MSFLGSSLSSLPTEGKRAIAQGRSHLPHRDDSWIVFSFALPHSLSARRANSWAQVKVLLRDRLFPATISRAKVQGPLPPLLFRMASAYWVSQAIYVAAKLGIADLLNDGPQSCTALARSVGSDAPSLFRLMRALSSCPIRLVMNLVKGKDDHPYRSCNLGAQSLRQRRESEFAQVDHDRCRRCFQLGHG